MIFERKIALKDIKEEWWNKNGGAVRNYKRVLLGTSSNTYAVFADYKSNHDFFSLWSGGGFSLPGSGLPNISDSIFMAGKTDNSLLLENGNWYLLAFSPRDAAQYPSPKTSNGNSAAGDKNSAKPSPTTPSAATMARPNKNLTKSAKPSASKSRLC